ncbi:hypothetical protein WS97_17615 [Burkholderia territorii]|nr:hypothetical protein WS97_17615 [Burkholderia territorii]
MNGNDDSTRVGFCIEDLTHEVSALDRLVRTSLEEEEGASLILRDSRQWFAITRLMGIPTRIATWLWRKFSGWLSSMSVMPASSARYCSRPTMRVIFGIAMDHWFGIDGKVFVILS